MKRFKIICSLLIFIFCLTACLLCFTGCNDSYIVYETYEYFGSPISIAIKTKKDKKYNEALNIILEKIKETDTLIDTLNVNSDVYKFNNLKANESITISDTTKELILLSKEIYSLTDGAFNPAVYPLVSLWGFSNDKWRNDDYEFSVPNEELISETLNFCNFDFVNLNGNTLTKTVYDEVMIDLGGIAKGYITNFFNKTLNNFGYKYGYINLSSSSLCLKKFSKTEGFNVTLNNPLNKNSHYLSFNSENEFLSTSGDYERYYIDNLTQKKYCHIIDGKTGYPVDNGISSATIICQNGAYADALTTALMVMGKEKAETFIEENSDEYSIILTYTNNNENKIITNITHDKLTILDNAFTF